MIRNPQKIAIYILVFYLFCFWIGPIQGFLLLFFLTIPFLVILAIGLYKRKITGKLAAALTLPIFLLTYSYPHEAVTRTYCEHKINNSQPLSFDDPSYLLVTPALVNNFSAANFFGERADGPFSLIRRVPTVCYGFQAPNQGMDCSHYLMEGKWCIGEQEICGLRCLDEFGFLASTKQYLKNIVYIASWGLIYPWGDSDR